MAWYIDETRDLAVAQIPRAGLRTIADWLGWPRVVKNDDPALMRISRRVAFIREPVDRLESAFSLFYWLADYGWPHSIQAPIDRWENFVEYVLDPGIPDDAHWMSQVERIGGEDVPTEIYLFEDLVTVWEDIRPGLLPHHNRTSYAPIIVQNHRIAELWAKYRSDIALRRRATTQRRNRILG